MPVISSGQQRLVIGPNGDVWGQGTNTNSELGEWFINNGVRVRRTGRESRYVNEPQIISNLPPIISVQADYKYSTFLDEDGRIWVLGSNQYNFLGLDDEIIISPRLILGLPPIKSFSAGVQHILFLDYNQQVWGLGQNRSGQLGFEIQLRDNQHMITTPTRLNFDGKAVQVSAGGTHSFILDDQGQVWAAGSGFLNEHGLSPPDSEDETVVTQFTLVPDLPPMKKILAGNAHSIGLTLNDEVVVFGLLSGGDDNVHLYQTIIPNLPPIDDISIGMDHDLALTEDGEVYIISMLLTSDDQTLPHVNKLESEDRYKDVAANLAVSNGLANLLINEDNHVWRLDIRSDYLYEDEDEREDEGPFTVISSFYDLMAKDPDTQQEFIEKEPLLSYDLIEGLFKQEKVRDYRIRKHHPNINLMEFELTDDSLYLGYSNYDPILDRVYLSEENAFRASYFDLLRDLIELLRQEGQNAFPHHELRPDFYSDERGNQAFYFVDHSNQQGYITLVSVENGSIYPPN